MMCDVYYGEIKENAEQIKEPYDVLKWQKALRIGTAILSLGDKYFEKSFQCDWGSFVWKCTKKQLIEFQIKEQIDVPGIEELSDDTQYGIVFIEQP